MTNTNILEPKTITANDIRDAIIKKAGPGVLVTTTKVSWFPMRDAVTGMAMLNGAPEQARAGILASMRPTVIDAGKPCPFAPKCVVMGIFEAEEIRIYGIGSNEDDTSMVLSRFRLSKSAAIFLVDEMAPSAFVDEMANEFVELRDDLSSAEAERAAALAYGTSMVSNPPNGTPYALSEFLEDLKEGVHLEGDDDDDDEEDDEHEVESVPVADTISVSISPTPPVATSATVPQANK